MSFWARQKPKNKYLVISKQQLHFRHALIVVTVIIFRASRLREFPLAPITNLFYRKFTTQKTTTKSTLMLLWWWPWTKVWKICNKKQFCIVNDRTYKFWFCRTVPRTVTKMTEPWPNRDRTSKKMFSLGMEDLFHFFSSHSLHEEDFLLETTLWLHFLVTNGSFRL